MKREHLFRAKRLDNGQWVYGSLLQSEITVGGYCKCEIHERFADDFSIAHYEVDPQTVGEWTGFWDKKSNRIFEGDLIANKSILSEGLPHFEIYWCDSGLSFKCKRLVENNECHIRAMSQLPISDIYQVTGNIYESKTVTP